MWVDIVIDLADMIKGVPCVSITSFGIITTTLSTVSLPFFLFLS